MARPKGKTTTDDDLLVVWILRTIGWSRRRIAKVLGHHHSSVSAWYQEAKNRIDGSSLAILPKDESAPSLLGVGSSSQLEILNGFVRQGTCGGGRQIKNHLGSTEEDNER